MKHTTRLLQSILCCLLLALLPAMALAAPADTGVLLQDVQARSLAWDGGRCTCWATPEGEARCVYLDAGAAGGGHAVPAACRPGRPVV